MQDELYMARALKLAARGRFTTHPNPNVNRMPKSTLCAWLEKKRKGRLPM